MHGVERVFFSAAILPSNEDNHPGAGLCAGLARHKGRLGDDMAKPNFKFQKRQKELDRKKKQDEKLLRKQEKGDSSLSEEEDDSLPEATDDASSPERPESAE